ncbi:MAG: VanW family protein [Actinomycetota bacterium]|nr:VanW family protein [Actinomycetota bacterium]
MIACAVVAVLVAFDYWSNAGRIYRGVDVGLAQVGGKTLDEARGVVEAQAARPLAEIRLAGPEAVSFSRDELGISLETGATLRKAYALGRKGNIVQRLEDRLGAAWGVASVRPEITYEPDVARGKIQELAGRLDKPTTEGSVAVSNGTVQVRPSDEGYETDVDGTLANLERAVGKLSGEAAIAGRTLEPEVTTAEAEEAAARAEEVVSGPVTLAAGEKRWTLTAAQAGRAVSATPKDGRLEVALDRERLRAILADPLAELTVSPREASLVPGGAGVTVVGSRTGKAVQEDRFFAELEAGLFEGRREYKILVAIDEPELTTAEAEALKPTDLIGSYRTDYTLSSDKSPERVENLKIASNAVSGKLLAPGEIFSFNELAAPLSYKETHVIVDGKETTADGGGLCQVASTLFNAANYAGLEIVERNAHFSELPYIRPGMDATVWFGALDMRFKNTTDGYLLIQESVSDDGHVYASIYGRPTGMQVQMNSKPTYRGADSSEWVTYKTVTENGKVTYDGPVFTTGYQPLVDEHGRTIPPTELKPAPIIP